jgi:hypothetical protein
LGSPAIATSARSASPFDADRASTTAAMRASLSRPVRSRSHSGATAAVPAAASAATTERRTVQLGSSSISASAVTSPPPAAVS